MPDPPTFYILEDSNEPQKDMGRFCDYYAGLYIPGARKDTHQFTTHANDPDKEKEMIRILTDGIKEESDLVDILSWKMRESRDGKPAHYGSEIKVGPLYRYMEKVGFDSLRDRARKEPQKVLNELKDQKEITKNLGSTYLITLLYFLSGGKWFIYDRFAMQALKALEKGLKPDQSVLVLDLPNKNDKEFSNIQEMLLKPYKEKIEHFFDYEYRSNKESIEEFRKIDQALWVYGHAFKRPSWSFGPDGRII